MKCFAFLLVSVMSVSALRAQVASAALLGEVHDESGALAPAVTVSVRHDATGFVRLAVLRRHGTARRGKSGGGGAAPAA